MIQYGVKYVVKWLNMFTQQCGVSNTYSPRAILASKPVDSKIYCKIIFGSYGQAINETNPTYIIMSMALGVIYLRALDTLQVPFEVINLLTGNIIYRRKFIPIPIIQEVIDIVEAITQKMLLNPC